MSEKIIINNTNGELTCSSLDVAKNFGKQHKDVLEKIENLMAENSATKSFYKISTHENRGKAYKCYDMTRDGFALLAMGFNGKKALNWKLKYIDAFNLMEKELKNREKGQQLKIKCRNFFLINHFELNQATKKPSYERSEDMNNLTEKKKVSISQLKQGKIWCNWVWHTTKDNKKTKRPLSKVNDPATWITYEDAKKNTEWSKDEKGIGIMFARNRSGLAICGIDIDAHHVDTNPLAKEILDMFSDTYIEKSPSGKGYHILFFAELDRLPNETAYKNQYQQKNSKLDVECYISGLTSRYFTFTGTQVSECDYLTDKTETLLTFLDKYMKIDTLSPVSSDNQLKLTEERADTSVIDVNKRLEIAMNANNGNLFTALYNGDTSSYNSVSEGVQAFIDMLVFYFGEGGQSLVEDVYKRSGLAVGKWAERDTIINTTISNAFKRVSERYKPHSNTTKDIKLTGEREGKSKKKPVLEDYEQFEKFIDDSHYSIRYNQITHDFEFYGFDKGESAEHLAENVPSILRDNLKKQFNGVTRQSVLEYITRYATRHKFNPVLNAIQAVKWDGVDRINQIYDIFKIPANTEEGLYSRIFIYKWLLQCVCGLFNTIENPFSLDIIPVFLGKQGVGKTRFFEKLALKSAYFGEGICLDPRDKDSVIQATSKWISELGELGSTMKKDMDSVKAFLTKSTDEYRTPYGKASLHYPRITSFVGTVNDEQFLIDQTGNRRFVTIPLPSDLVIDYETQIKPFNALQLWSQVYHLVISQGKEISSCFRLTENEKQYLEKRNSAFVKPMKGEYEVLDILEQEQTPQQGYVCTFKEMTVLEFIQHHNLRYDASVIGRVLRKHGYESKQKKINGTPTRVIRLPYKHYQGNN